MAEDPFEAMTREINRLLRRLRMLEEALFSSLDKTMSWPEELMEQTLRGITSGVLEPLIEVHDMGDYILVIVDLPGAKPETVEVRVLEDRVQVRAVADERIVEEALGGARYYRRTARYEGDYKLPAPVDPRTVQVERRGSTLLIKVWKKARG